MKRLISLAVLFTALAAVPALAFNDNKHLVDQVIRMWRSGVAEGTIIESVEKTAGVFDVSFDDVVAMRDAGVPRPIIRVLLEEAERRNGPEWQSVRNPHIDTDPTPPWTAFYDPWWFIPRYYTALPRSR